MTEAKTDPLPETRAADVLADAKSAAAACRHASAAHATYARLLAASGEADAALDALREAVALGGGRAEDHEALAFAAFTVNQHELSRECYRQVVTLAPADSLARYNLASAERNLGDLDAAEDAANEALARNPTLFQAALLRSQLRTQTTASNHVAQLTESLRRHGSTLQARIFLHHAIGKELEDLRRYDEAFEHFAAGAAARRGALRYDVAGDLRILQRIESVYDAELLRDRKRSGYDRYGFVLGMPRSGTTLIERVLTGHHGVRSNGETDNVAAALLPLVPAGTDDLFERATRADHAAVAAAYHRRAGRAPTEKGLVLEKLPLNYLYVGTIALAMPTAPIVLLRRHPMDNCLAMFTTLFGAAYPFSYDQGELARYYAGYLRLMEHWKAHLPDQVIEVAYDEFVSSPAQSGARLAEHCGLNWEPASLRIEDNVAPSTTASAVQVRKPIYKGASGRWRNYERQLRPMRIALERLGIDVN